MKSTRRRLLASSVLVAAAMAVAAPATGAFAQAAPEATAAQPQEIVVTGSILHRRNVDSDSPLTVETAADLEARGITTIQAAVQNLSGNNSGNLPNNFTGNGAFAAGASGASLRGLTTNSTLVLVDGLRAAYYPLADDGTRNFVDLNTIPDVIVDRVEVLQDGASATYGADAIAGVINIITKKTFQGFQGKVEGGFAQEGGAGETHIDAIAGKGDLAADGYNIYIGGEYERDNALYNRDRGFPYDTNNLSSMCGASLLPNIQASGPHAGLPTAGVVNGETCRTNNVVNGLQFDGHFYGVGTDTVAVVRPYNAANTAAAGNYQLLNPAAGCGTLKSVTITPAQATNPSTGTTLAGFNAPVTLCQQDFRHDYNIISPEDTRFSINAHGVRNLGASAQAYFEVNYYQNDVFSPATPSAIRAASPPAATGVTYSTASLALPTFVCPQGSATYVCNGTEAGAKLNPNNPFASAGEVARIFYSFGDIPRSSEDFSQSFRFATGVNGHFNAWGDWKYTADLTGMQTDLQVTDKGYLYIANLLTAVNQGTYNFANPSQNTAAIRNFVSPTLVQNTDSKMLQAQFNLSRTLFDLPGGPLQFGFGGQARYESIYDPSPNPDSNGPVDRYFTINPFGTIGAREVYAAFFELDAPVLKQLDLTFAGRYDDYSTGQDNFSPKFGLKFKPFDMLTLRATYSKGFRIPSFAEANSLPTTGYVTVNAPLSFQAQHGNDGYGQGYSLGLTTEGTAGLKPEKSDNVTAGFVFQPIRQISFSVDYYYIKKTGVIAPPDDSAAIAAYYAGQPDPAGFKTIPGVADPNYPNAKPVLGFIEYGFANLDSLVTDGIDASMTANFRLPWLWNAKWTSLLSATYVNSYNLNFPDGTTQHYAGTIGPCNTTSCSGTPRWRGNWSNMLDFGRWTVGATVYYTSGYSDVAEDYGSTIGDCVGGVANGAPAGYRDGATPITCRTKAFWDTELHATFQATKHVQLYIDIDNLFGVRPPYDATTYGGYNYNPAWSSAGILGRYFKLGAKATF